MTERQRLIAETVALLQQQEAHGGEGFCARNRQAGIARGADEAQFFCHQGRFSKRAIARRQCDDCGVELAGAQFIEQSRCLCFAHMDVQARMRRREVSDHARQQVGRHGRDHADPQPARQAPASSVGQLLQFIHSAQDVPRPQHERFAKRGEAHLAGGTLEEHRA